MREPMNAIAFLCQLGCRLPVDCLHDVSRRKTRRHVESVRHAVDASSNVNLVDFPIETQLVIFAEIDEHPGVARVDRAFPPINRPTSVASRCNFLSSSSLLRFRAADTARARSSCFLRSALRSSCSLEFIITDHYINSTGITILNPSQIRINVNVFAMPRSSPF